MILTQRKLLVRSRVIVVTELVVSGTQCICLITFDLKLPKNIYLY